MNPWTSLALAASLVLACVWPLDASSQDRRVQILATPEAAPDFTLTDQNGRPFRSAELRGREALVFFGFTHCVNICPAALLKLKLVAGSLPEAGSETPTMVLISVDGERDTPAVLKRYLSGFPDNFVGLTGDPRAVRKIAAGYKAVFFKGLPFDDAGNYQVEHTSMIYLVDAQGKIRANFLDAPVKAMTETMRQFVAPAG